MIRASKLTITSADTKAITIKDVARHASVSIKTVSRVMNQAPNVRPETRRRVEMAINELDYQPNPVAVSLGRMRRREPFPIAAA